MNTTEFYVPVHNDTFLYFDMGFPQHDDLLPRRSSLFGSEADVRKEVTKRLDNKAAKIQAKMKGSSWAGWQEHLDTIADVKANFTVAKVTISQV